VAGFVAASQKAGWFTLLFVILGLAIGLAFGFVVNKTAYRILNSSGKRSRALLGWALVFAYLLVPLVLALGAMAITGWLTFVFVRHIL
jgi:hypothetical protein